MQVLPRRRERIHAVPRLILSTRREVQLSNPDGIGVARLAGESAPVLLACDAPLRASDCGHSVVLTTPGGPATGDGPLTCFFPFAERFEFQFVPVPTTKPLTSELIVCC